MQPMPSHRRRRRPETGLRVGAGLPSSGLSMPPLRRRGARRGRAVPTTRRNRGPPTAGGLLSCRPCPWLCLRRRPSLLCCP
eukprot:8188217-Heterocapsa_arctica.AAC.1